MILDTNAVSAIADGEEQAGAALADARMVAIPVIVLGEYRFGIAQSRHRLNYERWIEMALSQRRVLEVTEETSARYAELRLELKQAGTPLPANDVWIAALCRQARTAPADSRPPL